MLDRKLIPWYNALMFLSWQLAGARTARTKYRPIIMVYAHHEAFIFYLTVNLYMQK